LCRLLCQRYCQAAYGHQHCQYQFLHDVQF
jgi:hypothetical protein